ncbi:MAG: hypothetical protein H0X17_22555 [Deltaproteobacteria bacterium]|nr:hypothetical protein [Deltaproteobacteria bacterium]
MRPGIALLALIGLGGAALPARADDEKPELYKMRFIERGQSLTVTANPSPMGRLFDSAAYGALDSGFTSTVVIRIWIYPRDSSNPASFVLLQRQVLYNLWDEVFELRIDGKAPIREKRQSEALKRLTAIEDVPVARLASLPYGQVFLLAMQVELNPVSKETLAEVRRWLSQGTGGGLERGGAFFGSFVSVFVNPKIPEADRVIRIRSQPFYRPRP